MPSFPQCSRDTPFCPVMLLLFFSWGCLSILFDHDTHHILYFSPRSLEKELPVVPELSKGCQAASCSPASCSLVPGGAFNNTLSHLIGSMNLLKCYQLVLTPFCLPFLPSEQFKTGTLTASNELCFQAVGKFSVLLTPLLL